MNENLARELAAIQDELKKIKPAVSIVNTASESVNTVEEKVPKLLEKMGALKISAKKMKGEMGEILASVETIGEEVSQKIDSINEQVEKALSNFQQEGENLHKQFGDRYESTISEAQQNVSEIGNTLVGIQDDYKNRVDTLIQSIKDKSKEIRSIYKELEKIKSAREEYESFASSAENTFKEALDNLERKKLEDLKQVIVETTEDFASKGESLRQELQNDVTNQQKKSDESIAAMEKSIEVAHEKYKEQVKVLLEEVTGKSSEIFYIYDEMDKIKATRDEYAESLASARKEQESNINSYQEKFEDLVQNADFPALVGKIDKLIEKVNRLEKHAHKHAFSGTKI